MPKRLDIINVTALHRTKRGSDNITSYCYHYSVNTVLGIYFCDNCTSTGHLVIVTTLALILWQNPHLVNIFQALWTSLVYSRPVITSVLLMIPRDFITTTSLVAVGPAILAAMISLPLMMSSQLRHLILG